VILSARNRDDKFGRSTASLYGAHKAYMPIAQLAKQVGFVESTSEVWRLIAQRGFKVDSEVIVDKAQVGPAGRTIVVRAGKCKFARITVS
jgi:tyrosyl-tRNA synthetase